MIVVNAKIFVPVTRLFADRAGIPLTFVHSHKIFDC